jgi:hypothetical protein
MTKLRPYGILTTESFRIEVKAHNLADAYRKAKKELIKWNRKKLKTIPPQNLTEAYETYGKEGISYRGFVITPKSVEYAKKYALKEIPKKRALSVLYGKVI